MEPARRPPPGLDGLDPRWSRLIAVTADDGGEHTWHVLDNGVDDARLTLLCVHGNPSWSYLWRKLIAGAPADVRVIAVDQLEMGYSERTGEMRRLATRIEDLTDLTREMAVTGPVVTVAHDWGGPISLGWAQNHLDQLAGVVLMNTAVHQPVGSPAPALIRAVRKPAILRRVAVDTSGFITGAIEMSRPRPSAEIRRAFRAPYDSPPRRQAIAHFVEDIPLAPTDPSGSVLDAIAAGMDALADTPALLLWGPNDKVFSDLYLHDLEHRLPHADVHRFVGASHFVSEDVDIVGPIYDWLCPSGESAAQPRPERPSLGAALDDLSESSQPAVLEMAGDGDSIDFAHLGRRIENLATGLREAGVNPGDRVALMVPPSIDLTVAMYACWRLGAVLVLIDAGLGPKGMTRALASSAPDHLIGINRALAAARVLRWPGRRFSVAPLPRAQRRALGVTTDIRTLELSAASVPEYAGDDDIAAVVFTSGATGPSKGVVYRHHQVQAQRDALIECYQISCDDRLVAAFAPFALYGPAMGVSSVVPDMDVTAPGTLEAGALGAAAVAIDATMVFASPAALVNVVKTADGLSADQRRSFEKVRLLLSAGAPVRPSLLWSVSRLFPNAAIHTPYGMTEVLPVADISLGEIEDASGGDGVCVGHPLPTVEVRISGLDDLGIATGELTVEPGVVGEVVVQAPHIRDGYDRLWHTQYKASQPPGWHRSGDVGHLDDAGRLWIGGRTGHVISTAHGPLAPVAIEQVIEDLAEVDLAAVVGVGPVGTQQIVAVVELETGVRRAAQADSELHRRVRESTDHDVAAVLVVPHLPVDRRHNSKIDRTRVAAWAEKVLAGAPMRRL